MRDSPERGPVQSSTPAVIAPHNGVFPGGNRSNVVDHILSRESMAQSPGLAVLANSWPAAAAGLASGPSLHYSSAMGRVHLIGELIQGATP